MAHPPDFLDWLAGWFALELDATWPEERRRALVANALELARWRGTVVGLALLVELYTGTPAEIDDGGAVVASDDPDEPLPGERRPGVVVRYRPDDDVDATRLAGWFRDAVAPARLTVSLRADRRTMMQPKEGDAMHVHDEEAIRKPKPVEERSDRHDIAVEAAARAVAAGRLSGHEPRTAVLRLQRLAGNSGVGSLVGREGDEESPVLDVVGKGGGSPLPTDVRTDMESHRAPTCPMSGSTPAVPPPSRRSAVQAKAYTVGNDVVFGSGAYGAGYRPGSPHARPRADARRAAADGARRCDAGGRRDRGEPSRRPLRARGGG